jgi:hypothetical protein
MPEKKCTTASCEEAAPRGAEVKQKKYLKVFSDSVGVFWLLCHRAHAFFACASLDSGMEKDAL